MGLTILALLLVFINADLACSTLQLRGGGRNSSSLIVSGREEPNATRAAALPGILDIWEAFPPVGSLVSLNATSSKKSRLNVAVCVTGHLRTFVLPGVYSGLVANVLHTVPGKADVFIAGHLGEYRGSDDAKTTMEMPGVTSSDEPGLKVALSYVGATAANTKITTGDCPSLEAAWQKEGVSGRNCSGNGNFMQIMWLDQCIQQVRRSGKSYDLIVRTRPDVGVFSPMPWSSVSLGRVSYMPKAQGGRADWFFTIPWPMVAAWWDTISNSYAEGNIGNPNHTIFNTRSELLSRVKFPAAIVRGRRRAQCWHLVDSPTYRADCEEKAAAGYFEQLHL